MTVAELDRLTKAAATEVLSSCCGSREWLIGMVSRRPFGSIGRVKLEAEQVWYGLEPKDWLEAFSHHPRIGETRSVQSPQGRAWSAGEQAGVAGAGDRNAFSESGLGERLVCARSGEQASCSPTRIPSSSPLAGGGAGTPTPESDRRRSRAAS